ncbi:MAG: hypothetical protein ABIS23_07245 [Sphingomicrobium sp.]
MSAANKALLPAAAALALTLSACDREAAPDEQNVIVDINRADPGEIETLPPDESVEPAPPGDAADGRLPEERGDGDDMVNIIDDTGNRT